MEQSTKLSFVAAPVRQQVVDALRQAISSGQFAPGQRLVERDLCEMFGVSRPPIREALRQLDAEGFVTTVPNRGPVVTKLDRSMIRSLYEVRAALEATAAFAFAQNATDEQIGLLSKKLDRIRDTYSRGDLAARMQAKNDFYDLLMTGSNNDVLPGMFCTINARINQVRTLSLSSPTRLPESLKEIEAIVAAITKRDAEHAFALSRSHVQEAAKTVMAQVQD
ncbi:GntR family transcriptional regulator [Nitratireductor sp. ZSWI3]|uniref:GntR family transcriptional regulator n=1 Tax=Nitratireductor sp. ZSWI3 TaxID=2966359 RepID=UPI00215022F8|nr:GntR family transcriptional regulator [Nitratireductor sp. ZSWI3]MCR4265025.1 GntR family transcriptional regulator [Nitratireductor sp. ZSWI3]